MDTIALNANQNINEEGQDKKKSKMSNNAKAAMVAGAVGAVAGAASAAIADTLGGVDTEELATAVEEAPGINEDVIAEAVNVEEQRVEVNPNDVKLEEPVAEPYTDADMMAEPEAQPQSDTDEEMEYHPSIDNDQIGEDLPTDPQPEENHITENPEEEMVIGEDPTVDMICGAPAPEPIGESSETVVYAETSQHEEPSSHTSSSIQEDLMA